ncbi:hypothetical protein [Mycolicibacterium vanbaalenii]|uniref:hypothetical protein n=1 Tax=Mycolicibacterium vanbaalenii TaxID=110539 RepID=UPI0039088B37
MGAGVGISAVGVTVVTVSAGKDGTAGAATRGAGAAEGSGAELDGSGEATVADTEPLSPPPRIMLAVITATNRIAPATPAIHIHRRSSRSSSMYPS